MDTSAVYEQILTDKFEVVNLEEGLFFCKRCKGGSETVLVYFSLHGSAWGDDRHIGSGQVTQLLVPFCRSCGDSEPEGHGCIHISGDEIGSINAVNIQAA